MKSFLVVFLSVMFTCSSWAQAQNGDDLKNADIKHADTCLDAYSSHIKGDRWSIYGGTAVGGILICVTPGILIYPFFSSTVTTLGEKKMATISEARQLLKEAQIRSGKRLESFVDEVNKGCGHEVSREEIIQRLSKLEEDFSYCRKSYKDSSGNKVNYAEPWSYEEIRHEMIKFFKG